MHLAMDNICFFASKGIRLNPRMEFDPVLLCYHSGAIFQVEPTNLQVSAIFSNI